MMAKKMTVPGTTFCSEIEVVLAEEIEIEVGLAKETDAVFTNEMQVRHNDAFLLMLLAESLK